LPLVVRCHRTRFDQSFGFGVINHRFCDTVHYAAGGLKYSSCRSAGSTVSLLQNASIMQWGFADQISQTVKIFAISSSQLSLFHIFIICYFNNIKCLTSVNQPVSWS
jgi:hypothetical protein